jgi:hypothetical protein
MERVTLNVHFITVSAVEGDHIEVTAAHIEGQGHTFFDLDLSTPTVFNGHISADNIKLGKYGIVKLQFTPHRIVDEGDFKGFGVTVGAGEGKTLKLRSAAKYSVGTVNEVANARSVGAHP